MSAVNNKKKDNTDIIPSSPCLMVHRPPIDITQYAHLSDEEDTSDDERLCLSIEDLRSKVHEKKKDFKKSLGLDGCLKAGKELF